MRLKQQRGITLIELMISLTIGLVVLGAASSVYLTTVINSGSSIAASRLNQDLMTLMSVMVQDIRRAGYWRDAATDPLKNPFNTVDVTALAVRTSISTPAGDADSGECILYAYDSSDSGVLDGEDIHGFRLNNGVVQMRLSGDTSNTRHDECDDAGGQWEDITDRNLIEITQLTFDSADPAAPSTCLNLREPDGLDNDGKNGIDDAKEFDCIETAPAMGDITVEVRQIAITMAGVLTGDSDVRVSVRQSVRVRNDLVRER
ncbi:PilW family protein [Microbulbifer yueqingensis]|uniref:Type IV pilus assembly protein PilW n=1 Tax=Microbulbifer yueqingensis TaxID=658219 RepID=A0A1G9APT7_9GAMM|nr:prepilin-type N-terminal cleavage/methylation domain-containing protein [Microbulbifer yueqingensis]SDK29251.1 type IV pilus assembly protein PilW [Microbulbifer yueqingensis]